MFFLICLFFLVGGKEGMLLCELGFALLIKCRVQQGFYYLEVLLNVYLSSETALNFGSVMIGAPYVAS